MSASRNRRDRRNDWKPLADDERLHTCNKIPLSPHQAFRYARNDRRRLHRPIEAYRCPVCRAWHIGHNTLGDRHQRRNRRRYQDHAGVHPSA